MELYYFVFNTAAGWIAALASPDGLVKNTLPQLSRQKALDLLGITDAKLSPDRFADLAQHFKDYFDGKKISFPDKLDISLSTPFQKKVWQATRLIAYGETKSYSWVADKINKPGGARAVGNALNKNPLPIIIPCHRIIGSNGKPGGFSAGLELKMQLLRLEKFA